MTQSELEGDTLGKKHQHYNKLLKDVVAAKAIPSQLNVDDSDVNNMLKIDAASHNKNLEYIVEALKNEDMLYVFRAIKKSTWLITDPQYAYIINPQYLYTTLFPQMTSMASNKLLLHIRLNLKDESRVDEFYNYYKDTDRKTALKWLPRCSLSTIEREIEISPDPISIPLLKRLSERTITILEKNFHRIVDYQKVPALQETMFLLKTDAEKYMDIVDSVPIYHIPNFGPNATSIVMKKFPQRFIDNFEKYANKIDLKTFAKHLNKSDIKDFLLKYKDRDTMRFWYKYENLKHFAKQMPKEGRFEFLKKVFIDKTHKKEKNVAQAELFGARALSYSPTSPSAVANQTNSSAYIYNWYRYAPFDIAFPDLKKLIRIESSPTERNAIFGVLLYCAGRNTQQLQSVLQYYHDKHINEPFKFKIQFVNIFLSHTNIKDVFNEKIWKILNTLFYSMEVYTESENSVQNCIYYIILYKILHGESVPEIIEKKFIFNSLKSFNKKLNNTEKEKIFSYLFNILMTKIKNKKIQNETDLIDVSQTMNDILSLLLDWKKEISAYPELITEIRNIINIKESNSWKTDLTFLYNKNKKWRKHMFEESLILRPSDDTFVNALRHDPSILGRHKTQLETLQRSESVSLKRALRKMRIYWSESLAKEWIISYVQKLDKSGIIEHKPIVRGLCILLPQAQVLEMLNKYVPTETKINWSEDNERVLSLRKQLAKYMHLARPLLPLDMILLYAHGDYLQYALPSLDAVLYNISPAKSRAYIPKFLNSPVSLQKHGIRLAFSKLKSEELKHTFTEIWKTAINSSIRAVLFKQTYSYLCKEKRPTAIAEMWELLSFFIDNLLPEENRNIYNSFGMIYQVPLSVRAAFFMKGYKYLKSLPAKANVNSTLDSMLNNTKHIMESIDSDFMAEILLETFKTQFSINRHNQIASVMSSYFLCSKDSETQNKRYEKVLIPFMDLAISQWDVKINDNYAARDSLGFLLMEMKRDITKYTFERGMVFPISMFINIQNKLEQSLPIKTNYVLLRSWQLVLTYLRVLEKHDDIILSIRQNLPPNTGQDDRYFNTNTGKTWNEVYLKAVPDFARQCIQLLKEDIKLYFPSVYLLFARTLEDIHQNLFYGNNQIVLFEILKSILENGDVTECALVALEVLPMYMYWPEPTVEKEQWLELRKLIRSHESLEVNMHYHNKFKMCDLVIPLTSN